MNMNLYGHRGRWLMVDCGVTFGGESMPGVEVITPDPGFIEDRRHLLAGLVLTHAHEDHLGAVQYLWRRLRCPIWATPFAASVLRRKLAEADFHDDIDLTVVPLDARFDVGPFDIELVHLTHSIPEPMALAIRTRAGTVFHTGDWKIDPTPLVGGDFETEKLRRLGDGGVLAVIGDSTNAMRDGESGSEADVRAALTSLFSRYHQRIAVGCFASNIARLESIAHAAKANGRDVALIGRSLWRMYEAARENGYLADCPAFLREDEAGYVPRDRIVLICTGSQGEPRAALSRIANDDHPHIVLEKGDTIVFSSRTIPGNERTVLQLHNQLVALGVEVVHDGNVPADLGGPIHVSGHPCRGELARMYQWLRPRIAVPVHGEMQHMTAHAALAKDCQVPHALVPSNGHVLRLGRDGPELVDEVHAGRFSVEGERLVPLDGGVLKTRGRMLWNGAVMATVVVDRRGRLVGDPRLSAPGLADDESADDGSILAAFTEAAVESARGFGKGDDEARIEEAVRRAIRRVAKNRLGKRPEVRVHVVRI
ncbi:MAG: ribonuclease J [Alphaproteobacteria bacterium]|nr:ribonuclease J [Alphaproteobacteria bacterium]